MKSSSSSYCCRRPLRPAYYSFLLGAAALAPTVARSFLATSTSTFLPRSSTPSIVALRGGSTSKPTSYHPSCFTTTRCAMSSSTQPTSTATTAPTPEQQQATQMDAGTKLSRLRQRMQELDLDVYLIPTDDPHLSEYVPAAYMRRAFLTDFHGSAGTAVVTARQALLWTDSRYWNEASLQLDAQHWTLQKQGMDSSIVPTIPKWLCDTAKQHYETTQKPLKIGLDPYVHAASFAKEVHDGLEQLQKDEGFEVTPGMLVTEATSTNLIDEIWDGARPAIPTSPFRVHPIEYAGTTVMEKMDAIRQQMAEKKCTALVLSTLDDVAYAFNLRAQGDIDTCPVGIAYGLITSDQLNLYCDQRKVVSPQVLQHLQEAGVTVRPYDDIVADVQAHCHLTQTTPNNNSDNSSSIKPKVWLDKSRANYALARVIPEANLLDAQNPVTPMKACKNAAELAGMREAHIVDGVAMAHFLAWLEDAIVVQNRKVSEVEIDEVLTNFRAQQPGFVECSFPTIAGVGSNGAIIHYRASHDKPELLQYLDRSAPILIDSGGQYLYGTTDVTRTWSFQETPHPRFVDCYTRVLKGNMGVDRMQFPEQTPGFVLDVYARQPLWQVGLNYGHGTGHGVGAALNVHEGPMSISPRWRNLEVLKAGMVLSNEPGYYEDGNFGVRIENLLEIQYVRDYDAEEQEGTNGASKTEGIKKFLKFAKLTMIPIQKNLIDVSLLSEEEMDWLDTYHAEILDKVGSRLEPDSPAMQWLTKACEKLDRSVTKTNKTNEQ